MLGCGKAKRKALDGDSWAAVSPRSFSSSPEESLFCLKVTQAGASASNFKDKHCCYV